MTDMQLIREQIAQYVTGVQALAAELPLANTPEAVALLLEAWRHGRHVFVCGNGGSAATASHFVNDLNKGANVAGKRRFRAIGLIDNTPLLMAWSNDVSYEQALAEQLVNFVETGDVLVAISGSGNSPNVLRAVETAHAHGAGTLGVTGYDGGKLKPLVDVCLHVPSHCMEQVEDLHMILCHILTVTLRRAIAAEA